MKKIGSFISKLKPKLVLSFALILIVPSMIIGSLSYMTAKNTVGDRIKDGINENVQLLNSSINNEIGPKKENITYLSEKISSELYTKEHRSDLVDILQFYGKLFPKDVELTYIGTKTGLFVQYPDAEMDADYDPRERPWYKDAMKNKGEIILSEPYISATTGNMVVTLSQSTNDDSGVVAIDISLSYLQDLVGKVKFGDKGFAVLLDKTGKFISHPHNEAGTQAKQAFYKKMYKQNSGELYYEINGDEKLMKFVTNETTDWKIGGNLSYSEVANTAKPIFQRTFLVIAVFFIIGSVTIFFVIKSIVQPINKLKKKADNIGKGNLSEQIEVTSDDEIGQLSQTMRTMQDMLKEMIQRISLASERIASHSEELTQSSNEVSHGTEQISSTMEELASGAETQANNASELSTNMEVFAQRLDEANKYGNEIHQYSEDVLHVATEGSKQMSDSVEQMQKINTVVQESVHKVEGLTIHSKEISKLVLVIKDIADQTNLLALNAAIEAARAGEQGKGFAVVADEVRKLAEQVANSIVGISNFVNKIQSETVSVSDSLQSGYKEVERGTSQIQSTEESFNKIRSLITEEAKGIGSISQILADVSEKGQEMSGSIQEIAAVSEESAAGIEETAAASQQTSSSMQEVTASAEELANLAEELTQMVQKFKL